MMYPAETSSFPEESFAETADPFVARRAFLLDSSTISLAEDTGASTRMSSVHEEEAITLRDAREYENLRSEL